MDNGSRRLPPARWVLLVAALVAVCEFGCQARHLAPPRPEQRFPQPEQKPARADAQQQVRCPDPYGLEGSGWLKTKSLDEGVAREMNERQGLVCSVHPTGWGCTNREGSVVIPFIYLPSACCYSTSYYFSETGLALVAHPTDGWVYVDSGNRRFGKAETVDNNPDEMFGGYARFKAANAKIGYLRQESPRCDSRSI